MTLQEQQSADPYRIDQIELATNLIANAFTVAGLVIDAREDDAGAFPIYGPTPQTAEDIARRALGSLLAHGWMPPEVTS